MIEAAGKTRRKGQSRADRIREIMDEPGWCDGNSQMNTRGQALNTERSEPLRAQRRAG